MNGLPGPERPARFYTVVAGSLIVGASMWWGIAQLVQQVAG